MHRIIISILVIILIIFFLNQKTTCEGFIATNESLFGTPYDGLNLHDDDLFRDTITYENNKYGDGWSQCVKNCNGRCVEMGLTSRSICFPRR